MKKIFTLLFAVLLASQMWAGMVQCYYYNSSMRSMGKIGLSTSNPPSVSQANTGIAITTSGSDTWYWYAEANPGYRFVTWRTSSTSTLNLYTDPLYSAYTQNKTMYAVFELDVQEVNVKTALANGCTGMGSVSGDKKVTAGTNVTIQATANSPYYFVGWSSNAAGTAIVSTSASYAVPTSGKSGTITFYAVFAAAEQGYIYEDHSRNGLTQRYVSTPAGAVDLGLPSGTLWADKNVGAPEDWNFGDWFSWGGTEPLRDAPVKSEYPFKDAQYDSYYTLPADHDAATVNWGDGWRMPTKAEFEELMTYGHWRYGVYRWYVSGDNGNEIFFPLAGQIIVMYPYYGHDFGRYWTADKCSGTGIMKRPYFFTVSTSDYGIDYDRSTTETNCYYGYSVRPVCGGNGAGGGSNVLTIKAQTGDIFSQNVYICPSGKVMCITPVEMNAGSFQYWLDGNGNVYNTGVDPTTHALTISVTGQMTFTAVFANVDKPVYTLTAATDDATKGVAKITKEENVTVEKFAGCYVAGTHVTLTATAIGDYEFDHWSDGTNTYTSNPLAVTTGEASVTYTAYFVPAKNYVYQDDSKNIVVKNLTGTDDIDDSGIPVGAVDLGLSVYWASYNLGATAPEQSGDYYAWGEIATKDIYSWTTYKYSQGATEKATKYCTAIAYGYAGFTDNKTTLEDGDEVVKALKGGNWRMPTPAEYQELLTGCTWTWGYKNHVYGYTISAPNGNSIFMPASGYQFGSEPDYQNPNGKNTLMLYGTWGYYWSNTLGTGDSQYASCLKFSNTDVKQVSTDNRHDGHAIRPVSPAAPHVYEFQVGTNQGDNVNVYYAFANQTVTINVSYDATKYVFIGWSDGDHSEERTFTITKNDLIRALFELKSQTPDEGDTFVVDGEVKTDNQIRDYDNVIVGGEGDLTVKEGGGMIINKDLTIETGGKLTVEAGAKLVVNGDIINRNDDGSGIIVKANADSIGELVIDPAEQGLVQPYGSVELYTVAGNINNQIVWQHFGIPTTARPLITTTPEVGSWFYYWDETEGWHNGGSKMLKDPFRGYNLTNQSTTGGVVYTFTGKLVGNAPLDLTFDRSGWLLFANSYTSVIYVQNIFDAIRDAGLDDDVDLYIQVYEPVYDKISFLKTITEYDLMEMKEPDFTGVKFDHILPMQAFFLHSNVENGEQLSVNYVDATANPDDVAGDPESAPRRAARRTQLASLTSSVLITVVSDVNPSAMNQVQLRESEDFSDNFDKSVDAYHQRTDNPSIYVSHDGNYFSSFATNDLKGKYIGFKAGDDTQYTISFSGMKGTTYAIKDMLTGNITKMVGDATYKFEAVANSYSNQRFLIVDENAQATDLDQVVPEAGVRKVIEDGHIYIYKNGIRYNAFGAQMK